MLYCACQPHSPQIVQFGIGSGRRAGERRVGCERRSRRSSEPTLRPSRITVIDDVVTKGATLLAAVSRVAEAYDGVEVRAFALLRTMELVSEIDRIVAPCKGTITRVAGDVRREP